MLVHWGLGIGTSTVTDPPPFSDTHSVNFYPYRVVTKTSDQKIKVSVSAEIFVLTET